MQDGAKACNPTAAVGEVCPYHIAMEQAQSFNRESIKCLKDAIKEANNTQWEAIGARLPHKVFWPILILIVGFLASLGGMHVKQMGLVATLEVKLLEKHAKLHESVSIMNALFKEHLGAESHTTREGK